MVLDRSGWMKSDVQEEKLHWLAVPIFHLERIIVATSKMLELDVNLQLQVRGANICSHKSQSLIKATF